MRSFSMAFVQVMTITDFLLYSQFIANALPYTAMSYLLELHVSPLQTTSMQAVHIMWHVIMQQHLHVCVYVVA